MIPNYDLTLMRETAKRLQGTETSSETFRAGYMLELLLDENEKLKAEIKKGNTNEKISEDTKKLE